MLLRPPHQPFVEDDGVQPVEGLPHSYGPEERHSRGESARDAQGRAASIDELDSTEDVKAPESRAPLTAAGCQRCAWKDILHFFQ